MAEPGERQPASGRPPRRLGRTRRSPWRAAFFGVIAVGLLVGVSYIFLGPKVLVVRSVGVSGTHLVPASQVRAAAGIPLGEPLLRVNTAAAARRVEAITQVRSAQVSKSWPDRILITVRERTPVLAVARLGAAGSTSAAAGGGYDLIDASGVIVRTAQAKPRGMAVFWPSVPGTALQGSPSVAAAATVLREVPAWIGRSVAVVTRVQPAERDAGALGRDHDRLGEHRPRDRQGDRAVGPDAHPRAPLRRELARDGGDKVIFAATRRARSCVAS